MTEYERIFSDLHPPLDSGKARIEASRCYYCHDAPCVQACPTAIDIPGFIRRISQENVRGAAKEILGANIMGGTCARVCPVETLCQNACVRMKSDGKPVEIGLLQRFATDEFFASGEQPFERAPSNGISIAVIGAGPAGLSCAHRLAVLGYEVTVFEAHEKPGGLNEYGLAPYKVTGGFVQREIDFILGIGGIEIRHGQALGRDFTLAELKSRYSAIFLGIGLGQGKRLGVPGEDLKGVDDAIRFIARIRQARDPAEIPVGRRVVVIGGGNTAVDIAVQMKRLGAEAVTLVYRRAEEQMSATRYECELARKSGVLIRSWAQPRRIIGNEHGVSAVEFECTKTPGSFFSLEADQVFKAIGQGLAPELLQTELKWIETRNGKIWANESFETSLPDVFAGGDAVKTGEDLTVTAVQQGKLAALSIHEKLSRKGRLRG